ncbi:MAG: L,D-transpeptidase [Gemmatimonadaceae bacterium]
MKSPPSSQPRAARSLLQRLTAVAFVLVAALAALSVKAAESRYARDVARMVFNDNLQLLDDARRTAGAAADSLEGALRAAGDPANEAAYLVISLADHRIWYKRGDQVVFATRVATGSGKVLAKGQRRAAKDTASEWKFETPRGRLTIIGKETDPVWVPPDWHYVEMGHKKKADLVQLTRSGPVTFADGSTLTVQGTDIVRQYADGRVEVLEGGEGREILVDGKLFIPPFGTNHRKFAGVLGTHRLNLGDGYALHGTDVPSSIGRSVSHGCVRLRNEDIETLYQLVPVGTPIYIY